MRSLGLLDQHADQFLLQPVLIAKLGWVDGKNIVERGDVHLLLGLTLLL